MPNTSPTVRVAVQRRNMRRDHFAMLPPSKIVLIQDHNGNAPRLIQGIGGLMVGGLWRLTPQMVKTIKRAGYEVKQTEEEVQP